MGFNSAFKGLIKPFPSNQIALVRHHFVFVLATRLSAVRHVWPGVTERNIGKYVIPSDLEPEAEGLPATWL
jgi:hypothetical protein